MGPGVAIPMALASAGRCVWWWAQVHIDVKTAIRLDIILAHPAAWPDVVDGDKTEMMEEISKGRGRGATAVSVPEE